MNNTSNHSTLPHYAMASNTKPCVRAHKTRSTTRKDSTSAGVNTVIDDEWTCVKCASVFKDEASNLLECEYCDHHWCITCLSIKDDEYDVMKRRADLHWYCPSCQEKVLRALTTEKTIEKRCQEYMDQVETRLAKAETDIKERVTITQLDQAVSTLNTKINKLQMSNDETNKKIDSTVSSNIDNIDTATKKT